MRRIVTAAATLALGCSMAACSSSSSSAPTTTASQTIATDAAGKPSCSSVKAALSRQSSQEIAIALKASGTGKNRTAQIDAAASGAKATTQELSDALAKLTPGAPVADWAQAQKSYIEGLAQAATSSAGSDKVSSYNSAFQASAAGKSLLTHDVAIKSAVSAACQSAGS